MKEKLEAFRGDQKGKVAVVTGADGHIGKELVKNLVSFGYTVCSVGFRNHMVVEQVHHYPTDLSDKEQVIKTAKKICFDFPKGINLVICNAGVMLLVTSSLIFFNVTVLDILLHYQKLNTLKCT